MADPICRWRNSSIKQVLEFNSLFPFTQSEKNAARKLVEKRWNILGGDNFFTTPYQLAAQMGMYYENDVYFFPKFSKLISVEEAKQYMLHWGKRYYAPNPYTKSLHQTKKPVILNNYLVNWCLEHPASKLSDALAEMFEEPIGNTDILVNMLNSFSEVIINQGILTLKPDAPNSKYEQVFLDVDVNDKKFFFDFVSVGWDDSSIKSSGVLVQEKRLAILQQIFYGAPGTGKSHSVCEVTKNLPKEDVFRITFHPDSDYASFVGCYKPTETEGFRYGINGTNTVKMVDPDNGGAPLVEKKITYRFVPQAFINAYVRAYHTDGPVFLVIEEINRGNCAQIFGDMFQLLDRGDSGESDYAIKPDTDIQNYLSKVMTDAHTDDEAIKQGVEMKLPANLYIWATMNTSDQSLFPIDSAFKRRWDWKYMPIDTTKEQWAIKVNGKDYSWGSFLEKVNNEIGETTSSEDKKLGFYFCKACDKTITAERFVSKVLFYIYNDVFKDYGLDSREFFKDKESGKVITFQSHFNMDGSVNEPQVEKILSNLGVEAFASTLTPKDEAEEEEDEDGNKVSSSPASRDYTKYSVNGIGKYGKNNLATECVREYIKLNPTKTADEVLNDWRSLGYIVPHFIESEEEYEARTDNSKERSLPPIPCRDTNLYVAHSGYGSDNGKADVLIDAVSKKNWGIEIKKTIQ